MLRELWKCDSQRDHRLVNSLVCPHLDASCALWQRIKGYAIGRVVGPAVAVGDLPGLKVLHGTAKHLPRRVVEGHIEVGLRGILGFQALDDIAGDDERSLFPFEPDFFNHDHGGIHPFELEVSHVRRSPKGRGATGEQEAGDAEG